VLLLLLTGLFIFFFYPSSSFSVSLLKACKKTSHPSCLLLIFPLNRQHIPGQKKATLPFSIEGAVRARFAYSPLSLEKKHGFL
jgi:hypothetical protein